MADADGTGGRASWTTSHTPVRAPHYAINLATRSIEPRFSGQADPSLPVAEVLDALEGRANGRAPLGERVSHPSPLDEWDGLDPNPSEWDGLDPNPSEWDGLDPNPSEWDGLDPNPSW